MFTKGVCASCIAAYVSVNHSTEGKANITLSAER